MDKYENIEVVGEGSYGIVMKCRHRETGQIVAIKKFLETEEDVHVRKMAFREIRMLKKLRHDNLVNMIEVFRKKRRFYLVFEYLDHTVLDELEATPDGLGQNIARRHIFQVLRGLNFCHNNHIMHRDVKPENVLVSHNGVIKLCDFGFARFVSGPNDTCTDYVATRWYRAPELLIGDSKYGKPIDVWALGCLYAEMVTGDPLFPGESDVDQLYEITKVLGRLCGKHQAIINKTNIFPTRNSRKIININQDMNVNNLQIIRPLRALFPMWTTSAIDFLSQCLKMDPDTRPSCANLLQHPLFIQDGFAEKFRIELQANIIKESTQNPLIQKRIIENKRHHTINTAETPRAYESAGKWRLHLIKELGSFHSKQDQEESNINSNQTINQKSDVSAISRRQKTSQQTLCVGSVPIIPPNTMTYIRRLDQKGISLSSNKEFILPALPLKGNKSKKDSKSLKYISPSIMRS